MNLADHLKDKDVICSANVELALYKLLEDMGISRDKIAVGFYDKQIGEAKERIYKAFSQRLKFDYKWEGHYKIHP